MSVMNKPIKIVAVAGGFNVYVNGVPIVHTKSKGASFSLLWSDARANLKDYRNNDANPSRMIKRRVLRTDYELGNF